MESIIEALNISQYDNVNFEEEIPDDNINYITSSIKSNEKNIILCSLIYSNKFVAICDKLSDKSMGKALNVFSKYRTIVINLCNEMETIDCKKYATYLINAKELLNIEVDPFPDPHDIIRNVITARSPFKISTGRIIAYEPEKTFLINMWQQTVGVDIKALRPYITGFPFYKFSFKNYIKHKIPLQPVVNGASTCYCDPFGEKYYFTTLILNETTVEIIKNLLIYGKKNGKANYIESSIKFIQSMCTDKKDYELMQEYNIIEHHNGTYEEYINIMKELDKYMIGFVISTYQKYHIELIKIVNYKESINDNENFKNFAKNCYEKTGILKSELNNYLYKSLNN